MSRIEELIDTIGLAVAISTLDLAKGYWKIPMAEEECLYNTIWPL